MSWRDSARVQIAEVIRMMGPGDAAWLKKVRYSILATYPWGERKYWPYKVWLDEAARQLAALRDGHVYHPGPATKTVKDHRQEELFK